MERPVVKVVHPVRGISVVGKEFLGDYARSPQFIAEIQSLLAETSTASVPGKVFAVYYDNPQEINVEQLRSFQGLFLQDDRSKFPPALLRFELNGRYLYTKVTGDPKKVIIDGYTALFDYVRENAVSLKSFAGYQVSTFENNIVFTEIYMELQ